MNCCQVFGGYLTENENQQSQDAGCDSYICVSQNLYGECSHERRNRHIYNIVSVNTVLSIFGELEIIFSRITARLLPCSARDCIRILFTVVIAFPAEEKNEESAISTESPPPERQYLNPRFIHSF